MDRFAHASATPSVSVINGGAVVQQEDPDHTAPRWSRTSLASSPNFCRAAARPHAGRTQILISAQCMKKAEFSITSRSDVHIDLVFL
eukprot:COSAG04_NODE_23871_length_332_cov_0.327586_1_plen_86_part_01